MKTKLTLIIACAVSLTACELHKVTSKQQLCEQAQRQQVYNQNNPALTSYNLTPKQQKEIQDQIDANCSNPDAPPAPQTLPNITPTNK